MDGANMTEDQNKITTQESDPAISAPAVDSEGDGAVAATPAIATNPNTSRGVTLDNFSQIWSYILAEIESGRWNFADWPLENLQEIPLDPDPEGKAVADLHGWVNRHLKESTQQKMYEAIARKSSFESKKSATDITLSEKTRDRLLDYRQQMFGDGKGSMEVAVRKLLDGVERTLPLGVFQKLTAFQRQNSLANKEEAINKLFELVNSNNNVAQNVLATKESKVVQQELQHLLAELKGEP